MKNKVVITVPKLSAPGGVSAFWNALFPVLRNNERFNVAPLEIGGHGKNILGPLWDQWNFKRTVTSDVDLVVLNPSLGYRSFFRDGFFAKQLAKKQLKFVVFFHGWDVEFEKKVSRKYVSFFRSSFGKAEKIIVLSTDFKRQLEAWGYRGDVVVETTTIDSTLLDNFSIDHRLNPPKTKKKKILFLSRLVKEKGIYETIQAFKNLSSVLPDIELVIAGDGNEFDAVAAYIKNDSAITMTGHVDGAEKIKLLKECHVYCLLSYTEGLPTSVLEAMAFGMPIITTAVGGLKDFFHDAKMGYFVALEHDEALERKLGELLTNEKLRMEMGRYNYRYAKNNLLNTVVAERLSTHFQQSISVKKQTKVIK